MESEVFSIEELGVIRTVFEDCDADQIGRIHINQLPSFLTKLGKEENDILKLTEAASSIADENEGQLDIHNCISVLEQFELKSNPDYDGSDPKVLEFLRILEEYRTKCEEEGNYLEAGRAYKQLGILRKQEEKRQQKVIQARQISERQDVQLAHNMQFDEFNQSWDKYMEDYDRMAQSYIQQMTERHAIVLLDFQKKLRQELAARPPRWSKELLDQRRKQHISARNKNYAQAQRLKKISDKHEARERKEMEQSQAIMFGRREAKFRMQQQAELQALLKRIDGRRKEHIKQRNVDTKRLLQRNKNVQAVLETKQKAESSKLFTQINKTLFSSAILLNGPQDSQSQSQTFSKSSRRSPGKKSQKVNSTLDSQTFNDEKDDYVYPDANLQEEDRLYFESKSKEHEESDQKTDEDEDEDEDEEGYNKTEEVFNNDNNEDNYDNELAVEA